MILSRETIEKTIENGDHFYKTKTAQKLPRTASV